MAEIFRLSWSWYDEYSYWLFQHPTADAAQWKADVDGLLGNEVDDYLIWASRNQVHAGLNSYTDHIAEQLQQLGYQLVTPIAYRVFGPDLVDQPDDPDIQPLIQTIGQDNLAKMATYNAAFDQPDWVSLAASVDRLVKPRP